MSIARVNWQRRKKRVIKNERKKLDALVKQANEDWLAERDCVWFFLGERSRELGGSGLRRRKSDILLSASEPATSLKLSVPLPRPMTFFEVREYIDSNPEVEADAQRKLLERQTVLQTRPVK